MKYQIGPALSAEIMTVHELALYLKMSDAKVYRMARTRDLLAFQKKNGRSVDLQKNGCDLRSAACLANSSTKK